MPGLLLRSHTPEAMLQAHRPWPPAVVGKQLELLKLVAPNSAGVAAMFNPANVTFQAQQVNAAKAASEALGLKLRFLEVRCTV